MLFAVPSIGDLGAIPDDDGLDGAAPNAASAGVGVDTDEPLDGVPPPVDDDTPAEYV